MCVDIAVLAGVCVVAVVPGRYFNYANLDATFVQMVGYPGNQDFGLIQVSAARFPQTNNKQMRRQKKIYDLRCGFLRRLVRCCIAVLPQWQCNSTAADNVRGVVQRLGW